jgi:hypothetical protein
MSKCPLIIDFEASSIYNDGSYPIEIAWTKSNGEISSHLINLSKVMDKVYWDFNSECVHNIPLEEVNADGLDPQQIVEEFLSDLDGRQAMISDGPAMDMEWMRILFAQTDREVPFGQIVGYKDFLGTVVRNKLGYKAAALDVVDDLIENGVEVHRTHRAAEDVLVLRNTYQRALMIRPEPEMSLSK